MTDFYLTVPFPQAVPRSAHLPGLEYCHPELRAALEAAVAGGAHLDACREAVAACRLPTPNPERSALEAEVHRAEADGAKLYETAQLLAAGQADKWGEHLRRRYAQASQRIEAAAAELADAYAAAVNCARLLPMVKTDPIKLTVPHGGPTPDIARRLSPAMTALREAMTLSGLPGITE
jgi:hypothetical protein